MFGSPSSLPHVHATVIAYFGVLGLLYVQIIISFAIARVPSSEHRHLVPDSLVCTAFLAEVSCLCVA